MTMEMNYAGRISAANELMIADAKSRLGKWQAEMLDGSEATQLGSVKSPVLDFLALLESQLSDGSAEGPDEKWQRRQDGEDSIEAQNDAYILGDAYRDNIMAFNNARIFGGGGDDTISAYNNARIAGGKGNDAISAYDYARVLGGDGDDRIEAYNNAQISGGDGDDHIEAQLPPGGGNDHSHQGPTLGGQPVGPILHGVQKTDLHHPEIDVTHHRVKKPLEEHTGHRRADDHGHKDHSAVQPG